MSDKITFPEGVPAGSIDRAIKADQRISKNICPNNCGIMGKTESGAECSKCGFILVKSTLKVRS